MKKNNIYTISLIGVLLLVFLPVLSFTPLAANDFPFLSQSELLQRFSLPYAWWARGSQGLGEYTIPFLWVWPMDLVYGLAVSLGLSFGVIERLFGILPAILLGAVGIRKLLKHYSINETGVFVGTLIYILNTYFILLIDGGQLAFALSYSWLPFVFLAIVNAYENFNARTIFFAGLSLCGFVLTDIRYVYLSFLLIGLYALYQFMYLPRKDYFSNFKKWVVLAGVSTIILVGILAYIIVPALLAQGANLPAGYGNAAQTNFLGFTTMGNAILLLQPHWYKNVFGVLTELRWEFIIFPLLAFVAPLFKKKDKKVGFWLLVSVIGIFLTKGSLEPLGEIYTWLFTNVPGFSLFRDSSKFFVYIALSYSVLSAFTIHTLAKSEFAKRVIGIVAVCVSLLITSPLWLGNMTGIMSSPRYLDSFEKVTSQISSDLVFGRILWIPGRTPLSYADLKHPSVEASRLLSLRPFAIGVVGNYELFNFLRDAPFMNQILKVSGIKYIAYPYPDEKRQELKDDEKKYYDTFLNQLTDAEWSAGSISEKPISVIKTKESVDHLFLAPNHYYVVGSDRLYWDLDKFASFDLSKNVFTFAETGNTQIPKDASVILYKKDKTDVAMTQIQSDDFIYPSADIPFEPKDNGWWKREGSNVIQWRAFLQEKYQIDNLDFDYGGGWAVSEAKSENLRVQSSKFEEGKILFARVMTSSRGGAIEFWQGDVKLGEIVTRAETPESIDMTTRGWGEIPDTTLTYEDTNVSWFEVSQLISGDPVTLKTTGDINVINALTVVSEEEWRLANEQITSYQIYDWDIISEIEKENLFTATAPADLTYERISPVHYKVKVEGITRPQTIVFSESYDSLWELNGQKSFPAYSFLNGFHISQNGEYDLYFSAQKYVNYGLVISGITVASLVILLLYFKKGTMKK